ncbi:NDT80/PhoG like DNA-binding family protein-like protein [Diplocarpon rosae]|nr:NDT80/PhoG like DNA-binding family protein-like protein [Diplocarpon rosae]
MDSSLGGQASPPLFPTDVSYTLQTSDGQAVKPEIFGKIDKGFFMADNDWTCYRRNYFSLNCSYTLTPSIPSGALYLVQHNGPGPQVHGFSMSIAAVVDGRDGKSIELVQHTPKRDKGPQEKPARITLAPRPPASHGMYGNESLGARAGLYEATGFSPNPNQPAIPMEPTLSHEEVKSIEESPSYLYYPGAMYESQESRYTLPSVSEHTTSRTKHEYSGGGYVLPSLTSTADAGYVRSCGRWDGGDGGRGFFPHAMVPQEMHIT